MENILLKIIASLISTGIYGVAYLATFAFIQFVVYRVTGISIADKLMKLVGYASRVQIGG